MGARARPFLLVLAIPAIGLAASVAIRGHLDSELRTAALKQVRDADATTVAKVATLTVAGVCRSSPPELQEVCQTDGQLALMGLASGISALAGLALLGGIAAAGNAARSNRNLLLTVFRRGLYLSATVITGLILAHAVIAIAVVYFGESALANRVHFGIILAIGIGALAGVGAVARSAFSVVRKAEASAVGHAVTREDAPRLWQQVDDVARRLGSLRPDQIVVGLDTSFFVTEADVATLDRKLSGRTLFCSLPLARILTIDEFTAIVGHELGHFRGEDTKFSAGFYPVYRGTATAIVSLEMAGGEGWGRLALLPAVAGFTYFLERFQTAESLHSRARELLADQAGAEATSSRTMASALVKVHAFSGIWNHFQTAALEALKQGRYFTNASATFVEAVTRNAGPQALEGLADTHTSHPTDSHPPLAVRLDSLKISLASVSADALVVAPAESAATLVPGVDEREQALSQEYQYLLASHLGIHFEPPAPARSRDAGQPARARGAVRACGSCGTRVLPTSNGTCPSCGAAMTP